MFDTESTWSFQSTENTNSYSSINIVLIVDQDEREMIPNVELSRDAEDNVAMEPLLHEIERRGYELHDTQVFYYSLENDWFVFCGKFPSLTIYTIPSIEVDVSSITLKVKRCHDAMSPKSSTSSVSDSSSCQNSPKNACSTAASSPLRDVAAALKKVTKSKKSAGSKRSNERKIGFVMEQVANWRRLYKTGVEKDGKLVGYSLQEAAKVIGISKKSLDDYLLQIRYGKKFGFDFQKNKEQGVGILRAYNKKQRDRLNLKKKTDTEDDWMNFQPKFFAPFEVEDAETNYQTPDTASLDLTDIDAKDIYNGDDVIANHLISA